MIYWVWFPSLFLLLWRYLRLSPQMKFVEKCFVLDDDIVRLRDRELCAAITFQSIQKHLHSEHIHFSFIIKKNTKEPWGVKAPPEGTKVDAAKPKAPVHSVPNKGSLRGNNVRKNQSIPDVKLTGGGVTKKDPPAVEIEETKKSQPPDYSSINKNHDKRLFASPAHCTEALKRNDDEIVSKFRRFLLKSRKRLHCLRLIPSRFLFIAAPVNDEGRWLLSCSKHHVPIL